MQEEQTFYPVTTEYFTACLPLLEKYFGITAGYFNKELSNAKCLIPHREGNIVKYSIKEDCNLVLPFRHLECHDLLSLINSYGTITPIIEEALSIPNSNNWLFRLIKKELASYFPEVQTAEEARQDIQRRKPSAGREKKNAIYSAVAYGIYRMLHEENAIPSQPNMPNELCQLIHDYTRVTGCYPNNKGESGKYDPKVIRADLAAYLKRAAMNQAPRFRPIPLQRQVIMQDFDFPLLD